MRSEPRGDRFAVRLACSLFVLLVGVIAPFLQQILVGMIVGRPFTSYLRFTIFLGFQWFDVNGIFWGLMPFIVLSLFILWCDEVRKFGGPAVAFVGVTCCLICVVPTYFTNMFGYTVRTGGAAAVLLLTVVTAGARLIPEKKAA